MSWLSFVIVAFAFYASPLQFATQICCKNDATAMSLGGFSLLLSEQQVLLLTLIISWLVIWSLISFSLRLLTPTSVQNWIGRITEAQHPAAITRLVLVLSLIVLVLAFGGLQVLNSALGTAFSINAAAAIFALFALIAEAGRMLEIASRDEDAWRRRPRQKGPSIQF